MSASTIREFESRRIVISAAIPSFNEEQVVVATYRRLVEALEALTGVDLDRAFCGVEGGDRSFESLGRVARSSCAFRYARGHVVNEEDTT
jgi:hypothetical protein